MRSTRFVKKPRTAVSSAKREAGRSTRNTARSRWSKPKSSCRRAMEARIARPEITSRDIARVSWRITSAWRSRAVRPPPMPPAPHSLSARAPTRADWSAGKRPKTRGERSAVKRERAMTRPSIVTTWKKGSNATDWMTTRPQWAISRPTPPPSRARITPSVRSSRTRRTRPAPRARRRAVSRSRAAARASIRLATFAQAMASTKDTATDIRARITHASAPAMARRNKSAWAPHPAWVSGRSRARRAAMVPNSAMPCPTPTPGLRRAVTDRSRTSSSSGLRSAASGVQMSILLRSPISIAGVRTLSRHSRKSR
jgi:hypothetical protein